LERGVVYTETTVFSPPQSYAANGPYQLAIVDLEDGSRDTVRILAEKVQIGDTVVFADLRNGVRYFQKATDLEK